MILDDFLMILDNIRILFHRIFEIIWYFESLRSIIKCTLNNL